MIDFHALAGKFKKGEIGQNVPQSGEIPHYFSADHDEVGRNNKRDNNSLSDTSPLSPPPPLFFEGVENNKEKCIPHVEGVATDNLRDEKTHKPNPIAVCLLIACCRKIGAEDSDIFRLLLALETIPLADQVKSWTTLCAENDIDPIKIISPYIELKNEGNDCILICRNKAD